MTLLSTQWQPLLVRSDNESLAEKSGCDQKEFDAHNFQTYQPFYSVLSQNHHHVVIAIGADANGNGRINAEEARGFLHADHVLGLQQFRDQAKKRLMGESQRVEIKMVIIALLLFFISRSLSKPVNRFVRRVGAIADGEPMNLFPEHQKIQELQIRGNALTNMQHQIKTNQVELILARDKALEAGHAKSQFLATMSHEIRTPMNSILGMARLLAKTEPDPRQQRYIHNIEQSGKLLLTLLSDVLDYAKIEVDKIVLDCRPFAVDSFMEDLVSVYSAAAAEKGLTLRYKKTLADNTWLLGDAHRLGQVFFNLLDNAIKFTPRGIITLSLSVEKEDGAAVSILFSVQDEGIGISAKNQGYLFEAFTQADSSTTRQYGGTGLGLAISSRIVSLMGGSLAVQSTPGTGSTFFFTLQLPKAEPVAPIAPVPSVSRRSRVLLVEDNAMNRMFLQEVLMSQGFDEIVLAENGREALDRLKESDFDLVLMDCRMPEMDGLEATRRLRQFEQEQRVKRHTPVIALTANVMQEGREKCIAAGMDDYVAKPVDEDELYRTMRLWLDVTHDKKG